MRATVKCSPGVISRSRLTPRTARVVCLKIRAGKPVEIPALPRNCKARALSLSQETARIDEAATTFAGEGGFQEFQEKRIAS